VRVALGAQRDGVLLRSIRQQHGLSQECVGKMAGRSRSWTNQIEQGTMRPSPDALAKLGRKVDARLAQQAARRTGGGAFVGPVLDGEAVDLHHTAVAAKVAEELDEAIEAARQVLQDILKPRSARTDEERRRLPELRLQLIDAERAIETLMVVLANESREDVASYYGAHDRKLASKGYTREHDHGGDAA
jgi:transcriptional regulator with XRE-family HTH domain